MTKEKKTYYIKLQDECGEIEDTIIVVETKRPLKEINNIIQSAIKRFYNGSVRVCTGVYDYIFYSLDANNVKWCDLDIDCEIEY